MVKVACPNIIGHLGRINKLNINNQFFSENENWYRNIVHETLTAIERSEAILEINTCAYFAQQNIHHLHGRWILNLIREMGIPIQVNSDAHRPIDLTKGFDPMYAVLSEIGFKEVKVMIDNYWQNLPINERHSKVFYRHHAAS